MHSVRFGTGGFVWNASWLTLSLQRHTALLNTLTQGLIFTNFQYDMPETFNLHLVHNTARGDRKWNFCSFSSIKLWVPFSFQWIRELIEGKENKNRQWQPQLCEQAALLLLRLLTANSRWRLTVKLCRGNAHTPRWCLKQHHTPYRSALNMMCNNGFCVLYGALYESFNLWFIHSVVNKVMVNNKQT